MPFDAIVQHLKDRFGPDSFTTSEFRDNRRLQVPIRPHLRLPRRVEKRSWASINWPS